MFYKLSEKMYQQANPQGGQPGTNPGCDPNCQGGDCGNGGDNGQQYYDADYTVVDDDKVNTAPTRAKQRGRATSAPAFKLSDPRAGNP